MTRKDWTPQLLALCFMLTALFMLALFAPRAHAQLSSITVDWTAPGDDSTSGTAASYEIRWSPIRADTTGQTAWLSSGGKDANVPTGLATWWSGATRYIGALPAPLVSGSAQTAVLSGTWVAGATYSFELRTCDEAGNCSRSNLAVKFVPVLDLWPPNPVRDLRSR